MEEIAGIVGDDHEFEFVLTLSRCPAIPAVWGRVGRWVEHVNISMHSARF